MKEMHQTGTKIQHSLFFIELKGEC